MTKKFDANKLIAGIKKDFITDGKPLNNELIEQAVQRIHNKPAENENIASQSEEPTKRTTLDIPKPLHKKISQRALDRDLSLKDYFLELVKKDLAID